MFDRFTKRNRTLPVARRLRSDPVFRVHRRYWSVGPQEKSDLLSRNLDELTHRERLRLIHLIYMEHLSSEDWRQYDTGGGAGEEPSLNAHSEGICRDIVEGLLDRQSPFRARNCFAWQGEPGEPEERAPDYHGDLLNASLTHLGCIEVIKIDRHQNPTEVDLVPLDDICGVILGEPSLFRAATVIFDNARGDESVYLPIIYGLSWCSANPSDHDGSMTRSCCHMETGTGMNLGVGLGQQDFVVTDSDRNRHPFGIGGIGEIMVGLELDDPRFEAKCRARGLDPDRVRAEMRAPRQPQR